ncbi:hypothetical protein [Geothrix campi]|uniref:hypothetical protein n=1 Tax=Geothrix campi TaxID=2966450 RepID=UPI002148C362|nr:hypothetical protein [Geothrix sp. SG10]
MSTIQILGSTEAFSGLADDLLYLVSGPATVPTAPAVSSSVNPYVITAEPSGGGFLDFLTTASNFVTKAGQSAVQVMNAAGKAKAQARITGTAVNDAYYRNIVNTPYSWFDQEMVPGLKNSALLAILAAAGLGLFLMNRKPSQVVQP